MNKKNNNIWPQYLKDSKNKITHVYLPINVYEEMMDEIQKYEKIQKKDVARWVNITSKKIR